MRLPVLTAASLPLVLATLGLAAPPPTEVEPVTETVHGVTITDDYRWLEALESESERVKAWTTTQNDYTRSVLDALPGRAELEARLAELMTIGVVNPPAQRGDRLFHTERSGTQNQPVLYVRDHDGAAPRVLLDPNTLDDRGLYALDWYDPSPDGERVAFGLSYAGDEMTVLYVLETATGRWLADEITGKVDFGGWMPDGEQFLYGVLEDPKDAYSRAWKWHRLGTHERADAVLYRQENPSRIPGAELSEDGEWLILQIFEGWSKQDIHAVRTDAWLADPATELTPIAVGLNARFEPQFVRDDHLYLLTTLDAPNAMIYDVDLTHPHRHAWTPVVPVRDDAVLRALSPVDGEMIALYQQDATSRVERLRYDGTSIGAVPLPGLGTASLATHHDSRTVYYSYESYNEPRSLYRVDLDEAGRTLWARPDVPVDPDLVTVKQEWCTSPDGTKVPMFIVHKKGLELDGTNPTLVYGYGGFNVSLTPRFSATTFPWFEHGGVYVSVTLRGGGEYGEAWHQDGMLANKQNVFDDLYAATEHLFARGYTAPDHCAVLGGSNGGLLTGVAATQRPDLYAAVISAVPLLDMVRFPQFLMAKFWVPEYGDPENPEHFEWIRAYSPYHNIEEGRTYPAILFTAGENDNRVHPLHARKMAAAMQAKANNDFDIDPIMLWVDREGGHGQGKPMHLRVRDIADRWSFVMWQTADPSARRTK